MTCAYYRDGKTIPEIKDELQQLKSKGHRAFKAKVGWNDDHRELRLLAQQTKIPLSGGESELTMFRCRDLIEDHAIQILQADSTMSGGYTALKKLAALCELNQVHLAPHHDFFLHAPLVASSPAGPILESFDADRDPLQAELFENPPKTGKAAHTATAPDRQTPTTAHGPDRRRASGHLCGHPGRR